ncbi:hypothetical protein Tco_0445747 [Tanacetum coccineum]
MLGTSQTDLIESMQNFLKKYDHIPHNEKSIKLLLAEEKFLKIKQKDQEEKSIVGLLAEERLQKANQALNESQSPQEMRIQDLEIQKQQCLEEMKEWMNDLGIERITERKRSDIEIDVTSFSDNSILRGIESDRDSGEDTISIDDLPLDDSIIFSEYESFTFDDEPVMAEVNVFDKLNTMNFLTGIGYPNLEASVQKIMEDKAIPTNFHRMISNLLFIHRENLLSLSSRTNIYLWHET